MASKTPERKPWLFSLQRHHLIPKRARGRKHPASLKEICRKIEILKPKVPDLEINPDLLKRIEAINWFAQCGSPFRWETLLSCIQVPDLQTAIKMCASREWEDATLDARNMLTVYLFTYHRIENNRWNSAAISAGAFIQASVVPRIENAWDGKITKDCLDSIQWDIHAAIMEDAYSFLNHPLDFFSQLLQIYEAGYFPCGWTGGEFPNGKLLVY